MAKHIQVILKWGQYEPGYWCGSADNKMVANVQLKKAGGHAGKYYAQYRILGGYGVASAWYHLGYYDTLADAKRKVSSKIREASTPIGYRPPSGKGRKGRGVKGGWIKGSSANVITLRRTGADPWYIWRDESAHLRITIRRVSFDDLGFAWEIVAPEGRISHGTTSFHVALENINSVLERNGYHWRVTATPPSSGGKGRRRGGKRRCGSGAALIKAAQQLKNAMRR